MTSTTSRYMGAVHDEADADIGTNRDGERVVRLDLTYKRGPTANQTTLILAVDAAITLRNTLDGLFAAAGIDDDADEGLASVDSYELMRFAKAFASLGDAVGSQVEDLLAGRYDEVNPNAVELIRERLGGMNRELDDALAGHDDENGLVDENDACPNCGERRMDELVWIDSAVANEVQCSSCGHVYRLEHTARPE